jgi:hypothetical protein
VTGMPQAQPRAKNTCSALGGNFWKVFHVLSRNQRQNAGFYAPVFLYILPSNLADVLWWT